MELARALIAEFFDRAFYLSSNPDVARAGTDPIEHYLSHGAREGRTPAPWFDVAAYRAAARLSPSEDAFLHFVATDPGGARQMQLARNQPPEQESSDIVRPLVQPFHALSQQLANKEPILFTAIAGARHALPNNTTMWSDMRVFSDTPIDLSGWKFHPTMYWDLNPKLISLFHKYCLASFVPEGTKLIWTDSRVSVQHSILQRISDALDSADLCVFSHYERDCVYEELIAVLRAGRGTFEEVQEAEKLLRSQDFPEHDGLFETGLIGMRAGPVASHVLRRVFGLSRRYLARDQITLPIALRGSGLKVHIFNDGSTNLRNTPGVFVHSW